MCEKAHSLKILIVIDIVCNHTGIHSIYYENPEYSHWYKREQNGKISFWWGFKDLPECNTLNKSYQDEMTKVIAKYLQMGADGIRLDLGESLPKEFLNAISRVKKEFPDTIFIGEMWGIATDKSYEDAKILDGQLDSVMNYPIADAILRWTRWGKVGHFKYNFERVYNEYPVNVQNLLFNNIATHDTPTTMTMLVGEKMNDDVFKDSIWDIEEPWRQEDSFDTYGFREFEFEHDEIVGDEYIRAKELTKIAIAILYTIPGIPCIYQGTEIAETGYKDPFNRKPYNWNKKEVDMKQFVASMGQYRKENSDILAEGKAKIEDISSNILIISRFIDSGSRIYLVVNRTEHYQEIHLPDGHQQLKTIFTTENCSRTGINGYGIWIARQ